MLTFSEVTLVIFIVIDNYLVSLSKDTILEVLSESGGAEDVRV